MVEAMTPPPTMKMEDKLMNGTSDPSDTMAKTTSPKPAANPIMDDLSSIPLLSAK